jgi:hypothetical protein
VNAGNPYETCHFVLPPRPRFVQKLGPRRVYEEHMEGASEVDAGTRQSRSYGLKQGKAHAVLRGPAGASSVRAVAMASSIRRLRGR